VRERGADPRLFLLGLAVPLVFLDGKDVEVGGCRPVATDEVRKADRSRASGPPMPGEHMDV
jgi:hypothetical protein